MSDWIQNVEKEMKEKGTVGAFTKQAKNSGMSVQDFAMKVKKNPSDYSETTRKRAQFALNMEKISKKNKMEKGGSTFAEGGEIYKKGDTVLLQDGNTKKTATVVSDGIDSENRVRVRPQGFPFDMSISTIENDRVYIIKKMEKGGTTQGYNDKLNEDLGTRLGRESGYSQSLKDRRDESKGANKNLGRRAYGSVGSMDTDDRINYTRDNILQKGFQFAKGGVIEERVYAIDMRADMYGDESFFTYNQFKRYADDLSDDEFMDEAETQGLVWSSMDGYIMSNEYNEKGAVDNLVERQITVKMMVAKEYVNPDFLAKGGEISEAKLKKMLKDDDVSWSSNKEFFEIAHNHGWDYDDDEEIFVPMKTYNEGSYSDKDDDEYKKGGKIKVVEKSEDGMVWGRSFPQGEGRAYQRAKDRIESLGKKFDKVMIDGKEISLKEFHNLEEKFDNQSFARGGSVAGKIDKDRYVKLRREKDKEIAKLKKEKGVLRKDFKEAEDQAETFYKSSKKELDRAIECEETTDKLIKNSSSPSKSEDNQTLLIGGIAGILFGAFLIGR